MDCSRSGECLNLLIGHMSKEIYFLRCESACNISISNRKSFYPKHDYEYLFNIDQNFQIEQYHLPCEAYMENIPAKGWP